MTLKSHRVITQHTTIDDPNPVPGVWLDHLLIRSALGMTFLPSWEGRGVTLVGGDPVNSEGLGVEDPFELGTVEDTGYHRRVVRLDVRPRAQTKVERDSHASTLVPSPRGLHRIRQVKPSLFDRR